MYSIIRLQPDEAENFAVDLGLTRFGGYIGK